MPCIGMTTLLTSFCLSHSQLLASFTKHNALENIVIVIHQEKPWISETKLPHHSSSRSGWPFPSPS
uniref:Secreted protein n=1 Tax=Arundo donax TaxID=35708 RepID=A0A0A8XYE1_ARUDO